MAQAAIEIPQAESVPLLPDWANKHMRLDPYRVPHRVELPEQGGFSYTLDKEGAVVKRQLPSSGLALSLALPVRAFKGVAARAIEQDGKLTVTLELHHHDPALCVPLMVSDDLNDVAADWHSWSRLMGLPMLLVEEDKIAKPLCQRLGAIMIDNPLPRRKRFGSLKHRPRFLRRRKPGAVGPVVRLKAEEIIARR